MRCAAVSIAAALAVTLSMSTVMAAPQTKDVRGKVTAISGNSVTVDVNGQPMTFAVNTSTEVIAKGAGTKARETQGTTGQKPGIADLLKVGDNVEVRYTESGGAMTATVIRGGLPAAPPPSSPAAAMKRLQGVVTDVSATGLTIKPGTGEPMNFMVDDKARFTGTGLGTLAKEKQEAASKLLLTEAVAVGDTVEVTYKAAGDMAHATAVRVITKKK